MQTTRRYWLKTAGLAGAVTLAGCTGGDGPDDGADGSPDQSPDQTQTQTESGPERVVMVAGDPDGTVAQRAAVYSSIVNNNRDDIQFTTQSGGGSLVTMRLLDRGDGHLGEASTGTTIKANTNAEPFDEDPIDTTMCMGFGPQGAGPTICKVDKPQYSDVNSIADIPEGSTVSPGSKGSTIADLTVQVFEEVHDINPLEYFEWRYMGFDEMAQAAMAERIDFFFLGTVNRKRCCSYVLQVDNSDLDWQHLDWGVTEEELHDLGLPYGLIELDAGIYKNTDFPYDTYEAISIPFSQVVPQSVDEDLYYRIMDTIMENQDRLTQSLDTLSEWTPEYSAGLLPTHDDLPIHPGALRWYEENGLAKENWTTV